tara:strand:- start:55 stop:264 length:210 start_codon:yes stop_codon:yes gene_type:complete
MVTTQYTHLTLVEPFQSTLLALPIALLIILLLLAVVQVVVHMLVVVAQVVIVHRGTLRHLAAVGLVRQV